jgi:hypothetical protein
MAPAFAGCDAQTAIRFAPPRDGFSIRDDLWKLLIENRREHL